MADVTMSVEEYLRLVEAAQVAVGSSALTPVVGRKAATKVAEAGGRIQRRASGVALKGMASALKKANAKARKKNGSFKKGWTQARVMKEAHRLRRRSK
jgi:hypothetical protein